MSHCTAHSWFTNSFLFILYRYGMSFIEQVSLNHISPWLSGGDNVDGNSNGVNGHQPGGQNGGVIPECKGV